MNKLLKQRADSWARTAWGETDLADSDKTDPKILALVRAASSMGYSKGWEDGARFELMNRSDSGLIIVSVLCLVLGLGWLLTTL